MSLGGTALSFGGNQDDAGDTTTTTTTTTGPRHLEPMRFAPLSKNHGWYAVEIASVHLGPILLTPTDSLLAALNDAPKGTIIDSGTTDTYLPRALNKPFREAWKRLTGSAYGNRVQRYTAEQFAKLPNVTIGVRGIDGDVIRWSATPASYMEEMVFPRTEKTRTTNKVAGGEPNAASPSTDQRGIRGRQPPKEGDGIAAAGQQPPPLHSWEGTKSFTNRIYVDEPRGCVLGANFMAGHDVLFDVANRRIGLARADCAYRESEYVVV